MEMPVITGRGLVVYVPIEGEYRFQIVPYPADATVVRTKVIEPANKEDFRCMGFGFLHERIPQSKRRVGNDVWYVGKPSACQIIYPAIIHIIGGHRVTQLQQFLTNCPFAAGRL